MYRRVGGQEEDQLSSRIILSEFNTSEELCIRVQLVVMLSTKDRARTVEKYVILLISQADIP